MAISGSPRKTTGGALVPAIFAGDERTAKRYIEFFAVNVRNRNTRAAYMGAARRFAGWCSEADVDLVDVEPVIVAAYVEQMQSTHARATVKQHLAGIRMLFDWLVVGHIVETNPAAAVRGPRHVVKVGKAPVLTAAEARELLDSIDVSTMVGLRDRALIAVMTFGFARVTATISMRVQDYYTQGKRSYLRLHEKGGRYNQVPAHHLVQEYLDAYVEAAGISDEPETPLFRSGGRGARGRVLQAAGLTRQNVAAMVKRRAKKAGLPSRISPHSFRATGITEYMRNGGDVETAARIAGHESTRTTQLYNRVQDDVSLDEIERIHI